MPSTPPPPPPPSSNAPTTTSACPYALQQPSTQPSPSPARCPSTTQTPLSPAPVPPTTTTTTTTKMHARQTVLAVFDNYFTLAAPRRFQGWDMDLMQRLRAGLTDAGAEGRTVFVVEVQEREANINDAMHGGA